MVVSKDQTSRAIPVAVVGDRCGEGALWSPEEQAVYWTDINRFLVHRLLWPDCRLKTWDFEEPPTALALSTEPGRLLVALASRLVWWWPADDRRSEHGFKLADWPKVRLNDGRADPLGNFWVGSMFNNVAPSGGPTVEHYSTVNGILFRVSPDGCAQEVVHNIGIANTICWSPDQRRFYSADTMKNEIRRYNYDIRSGDIAGEEVHFANFSHGIPDGSAMDREGYLWNARWGGGGVVRIIADGGYAGPKMAALVARTGAWTLQIVKRSDASRFVVLPKRWIVERTLAWISRHRRLSRDYERHTRIAAAFVKLAMIPIMLRRVAVTRSA